jgi:SAM-dependent methyltransferase
MDRTNRPQIRRFLYPTAFGKGAPDVGWDPTPRGAVDEMIDLARVRSTDIVYDLGCGDGRIVIAAAAKTGAYGVGVDLDLRRIEKSRENAVRAGVEGLTRFLNENLFRADIRDATVLFLFLFPDVNLRLRPKLLRELKPGTRIVSYSHDMGRWRPDKTARGAHDYVHLWIVPGNGSGTWEGGIETGEGPLPLRMNMRQEFQRLSGSVFVGSKVFQAKDVAMDGEEFTLGDENGPSGGGLKLSLHGVIRDDTVTGTIRTHTSPQELPFAARRAPSTRMSLVQ